jgi:hypothetical protein
MDKEAIDRIFSEGLGAQGARLGIEPYKVESPLNWGMRVRKAALLEEINYESMPLQPDQTDLEQRAREMLDNVTGLNLAIVNGEVRVRRADALAAVVQALASSVPEKDRQWQDIETAPKDGRLILLCWLNWEQGVRVSRWMKTAQRWTWDGSHSYKVTVGEPAYWRPLPTPPEAPQDGASQWDGRP